MSASKKKKRKKLKFNKLDIYVMLAMTALTLYTISCQVLIYFDKTPNDTLTTGWFAAWTTELAILWRLKINDDETSLENYVRKYEE